MGMQPDKGQDPVFEEKPGVNLDSNEQAKDLDYVGAKSIELYQNHLSLLDRIWAYFSQYSALLIIFVFLVLIVGKSINDKFPDLLLGIPLIVYVVFAAGNHRTLRLTLEELRILRGIAVTKTRYTFKGTDIGTILRFHIALTALVVALYILTIYFAMKP